MISLDAIGSVVWGHAALTVVVDVAPDGPVGVRTLAIPGPISQARASQPLVELLVPGAGRARSSHRFSQTAIGRRLAYLGSERTRQGQWHQLRIDLQDAVTGLTVEVCFRSADQVSACQVRTRLTNHGDTPVLLLGVTSFAATFPGHQVDDIDLLRGDSEWLGEGRWTRHRLRDGASVDLNLALHGQDGRGRCRRCQHRHVVHRDPPAHRRPDRLWQRAVLAVADRTQRRLAVGSR